MATSLQNVLQFDQLRIDASQEANGALFNFSITFPGDSPDSRPVQRTYIPPSRREMEDAVASISRVSTGGVTRAAPRDSLDAARELGTRLFTALFGGEAGKRYLEAVSSAEMLSRGLCVRLVMDDDDLAATPWEVLFDVFRDDFVALRSQFALVRERRELRYLPLVPLVEPPLRVLVVAPPFPLMPAPPELEAIERLARDTALISLDVRRGISPEETRELLSGGWHHVIHLMDAGAPTDVESGSWRPGLMLRDAQGVIWELPATALVEMLGTTRHLHLVSLSGGQVDRLAGRIASVVPSVIGVRGTIADAAASAFVGALYRSVIEGQPLVQAVTRGRQAVDFEVPGSRQWSSLVAYIGSPRGFQLQVPRAETIATRSASSQSGPAPSEADDPERRRLSWLVRIERNNLEALQAQQSRYAPVIPETAFEATTSEIDAIQERIRDLEAQLDDAPPLS